MLFAMNRKNLKAPGKKVCRDKLKISPNPNLQDEDFVYIAASKNKRCNFSSELVIRISKIKS